MEKYLIVIDIDGTLLNNKKEISPLTKEYLIKLNKEGHKIVLASGRPVRAMLSYYNELELDTPIICYNGALVYNPKDPNYPSHEWDMNVNTLKTITKDISPFLLKVMCETKDTVYIDHKDQYLSSFFYYKGMKLVKGNILETLNENTLTYIAKFKEGTHKSAIYPIVEKNSNIKVRFWTGAPYFELYLPNVSKGGCMLEIANYYNIEKDHIIVFGDADNDVELFEYASKAVAMSNSHSKSARIAADIITEYDNDNDGVYYELKKLIS